jgi:hypothetical protein
MFTVRWVVHGREDEPVEREEYRDIHADVIAEACKLRLASMRRQFPKSPPDGFLVFDRDHTEVRRWFGLRP